MNHSSRQGRFLAGDIGGTKTNLGCYTRPGDSLQLRETAEYPSQEAGDLGEILADFLDKHPVDVTAACFGIAGPVMDGRCKTTNLPWEVSEEHLRRKFGWRRVKLINDLAATALAIPMLDRDDTVSLKPGRDSAEQTIALIAPGTGLGQAMLVWSKDRYVPLPSEGGHADFAPTTDRQVSLWRHLHEKLGHVSIERVASGPGLVSIYAWMKDTRGHAEPEWLKQRLTASDPAAVIAQAGLDGTDPMCAESLELFVSILGAAAGNLALTGLARGGVYLGGGIPPKILPKLQDGPFRQSFVSKGRFKAFLEDIPVRVILNESAALLGAAGCAARLAE